MKQITDYSKPTRPERVIQFGEGGFLRGFVDWMLAKLNAASAFDGSVVVVQPIREGLCDLLSSQNCLYTHKVRGAEGTETSLIDVISRCVKPYEDFSAYLALADNPDARFIVSNTTEAGIVFRPEDKATDTPPESFPAKLTLLLHRRYGNGLPGFILLPCELIDRNGDNLKRTVLQYAELWGLGEDFKAWVERENVFCNTLVDRINTGYPKDEPSDLPYEDKMLNTSEFFHLWVIETELDLERELPFSRAGLNVIVTRDKLELYRTRKVRILNGAHTSMVAYALLSGLETVKDAMDDPRMSAFIRACLFEEIIPTLDLPKDELEAFANDVLVRFSNPYIKHYLSAISLNSISKFCVRVLPSIKEYKRRTGKAPAHLLLGWAKLIEFYRVGDPKDAPEVIGMIRGHELSEILANTALWGENLNEWTEALSNADSSAR